MYSGGAGSRDADASFASVDSRAVLPPELRAAAAELLTETDAVRQAALAELRAALGALSTAEHPWLPFDLREDALLCLLRARAFDVPAAAKLAVHARAFQLKHPRFFNLSRDTRLRIAASGFLTVLQQPGLAGHRVMALRPALMPLELFSAEELIGFQLWVLGRLSRDPLVQVHGLSSLSCYADMTLALTVKQFRLMPLATRIAYQRDCYTPRYGPIFIWNLPRFVVALFKLAEKLLPATVTAHVRLHGKVGTEAAALMELAHVPRAFGGTLQDDGAHMRAWMERELELEAFGQ
jgi:hypothetical protein